ncbi:hypothetical protein PIB30_065207 [Stylosanthes scabra]|uniref:Uncharacterized protein n=1 Tax=Stylosanthes scabra TaxID=79078 RepID=A0ABU6SME8_9FABA|nr:hypothetical protein [Stylosanthes scabra]
MSLSLIQGYSSAEEDDHPHLHDSSSDDDDHHHDALAAEPSAASHPSLGDRSIFDRPQPSSASGLPSAFDAFSEVAGPPQFLNNSVEEYIPAKDSDQQQGKHGSRRNRRDKKDLPTGAVVEAKPQLVGIHERVRSDNGSQPPVSAASSTPEGGKRMPTATNPNAEDAADLLRYAVFYSNKDPKISFFPFELLHVLSTLHIKPLRKFKVGL